MKRFSRVLTFAITAISISVPGQTVLAADPPLGSATTGKNLALPSDFHDDDDGCSTTALVATGTALAFDGLVYGGSALHKWTIANAISAQETGAYLNRIVVRMQKDPAYAAYLDGLSGGNGNITASFIDVGDKELSLELSKLGLKTANDKIAYLRRLRGTDFAVDGSGFQMATGVKFPIVDSYEALGLHLKELKAEQAALEAKYPIDRIVADIAEQAKNHEDWKKLKKNGPRRALTLTETTQLNSLADAEAKYERLVGQQAIYVEKMVPLLQDEAGAVVAMDGIRSRNAPVIDAFLDAAGRSERLKPLVAELEKDLAYSREKLNALLDDGLEKAQGSIKTAIRKGMTGFFDPELNDAVRTASTRTTDILRRGTVFDRCWKKVGNAAVLGTVMYDLLSMAISHEKRANENQQAGALDDTSSIFSGAHVDDPNTKGPGR